MRTFWALIVLLSLLTAVPMTTEAIGVNFGRVGDNLPSAAAVVQLYQSNNIDAMRIFSPDSDVLNALSGTGIAVIVDVPNSELPSIASSPSAAATWVSNNIAPYSGASIKYIAVGNEVPGAANILPAMMNIHGALNNAGLGGSIAVSTAVATWVLSKSYPPSQGAFNSYMDPIIGFLASTGAPLLANVYPYFAYAGAGGQISLDYALFRSPGTVVQDGQYAYRNLFDAMVDATYAAMEKAGGSGVGIVVSESGWPSAGAAAATVGNAQAYNQGLIDHVGKGTPRRPGPLEAYIFAMFNEDLKTGDATERNFGLFFPNQQPVYSINFS